MLHGETGVFQKTTPCLLYTRGTASGGSLSLLTGALEAQWAAAKSRTRAVQPQARLGTGVAATLSTREALPARACLPIPVATRRPVPTSERARVEGSLGSSACMLPFPIFPVGASSAARLTYPKKMHSDVGFLAPMLRLPDLCGTSSSKTHKATSYAAQFDADGATLRQRPALTPV